jgi:hypothetical protein
MSTFAPYLRAPGETPYFSVAAAPPVSATAPDTQVVTKKLFVDNRDRHPSSSASPFDFKIVFGNDPAGSVGIAGYRNVVSVELKALAFPKVVNERYVIIRIDELTDNMLEASCSSAQDAFSIMYFDSDALATGAVKPLKGADFYQKTIVFRRPLAKLDSLSIRFLKYDGTIVTLAETGNVSHVSMLFEITQKANRTL